MTTDKIVKMTGTTKADQIKNLKELIRTDPEVAMGAALTIYQYQTEDEQATGMTHYDNNMGFSGVDAGFLTGMIHQYQERKELSQKQMSYIHKLMPKYSKQLLGQGGFASAPITILTPEMRADRKRKKKQEKIQNMNDRGIKAGMLALDILENGEIKIEFAYNPELVSKVKRLSGRKFHAGAYPFWTAPFSRDNVLALREMGNLTPSNKYMMKVIELLDRELKGTQEIEVPGLLGVLRPFQKEGVGYIESRK
jgi:hypothetical protein